MRRVATFPFKEVCGQHLSSADVSFYMSEYVIDVPQPYARIVVVLPYTVIVKTYNDLIGLLNISNGQEYGERSMLTVDY